MRTHRLPAAIPSLRRRAFTLVEIVGVVALIAILAAILTPRVVSVISRGKINATADSLAGLRTATMDYLGVHSTLPARLGTGATNAAVADGRFDADLVAAGFLEKLFTTSLGDPTFDDSSLMRRTHVRCLTGGMESSVPAPDTFSGGTDFDLDRDPATVDTPNSSMVVSAFIPKVRIDDAIALNKVIDGDLNPAGTYDRTGRCIYSQPSSDGTVTVYVYITHR